MALREIGTTPYIPFLSIRPAEMAALQQLPSRDKDMLVPYFELRPWVGAHQLENAIDRLTDAYGDRAHFLGICAPDSVTGSGKPVHEALAQLRNSADGFAAWCQFVEERERIMPALQLTDADQFETQARRLHGLGRGTLLHLERFAFRFAQQIANRTASATEGGQDVLVLVDYGRQNASYTLYADEAEGLVETIRAILPAATIALSASSFPDSFSAITEQAIYERILFESLKEKLGLDGFIYSDRGSARAERQTGGGGSPAPRIDYALAKHWEFYRSDDDEERKAAYQRQARRLMRGGSWDPKLRVWGTQMIERTALGDETAITSPARATAARINIHLHQQLFFDNPEGLYATDEDWSD